MNFNRPKFEPAPAVDRKPEAPSKTANRWRGRLAIMAVVLAFVAALGFGAWRHYSQYSRTIAVSKAEQDSVPQVRVAAVEPSDPFEVVTLPATTSAFASANVFARASGYIARREVDIGDHVKAGQLLAQIEAPELDHQIAQARATLGQLQSALQQADANRKLAQVTWDRDRPLVDKGWVTAQQGTIDEQTLKAQEAAVSVAQANTVAEQAQLQVLEQQKAYQRVVAPFNGVITQRNIDVGSLVQADATSGTFMFTIMQSDVIRTQAFVPQDEAFGVKPGIDAVIHVPELPDRTFPGKVTRTADALQPGSRTLLTEVDIPNPDGTLPPGIYCTIDLHVPRKTPSFKISADAIIFNAGGDQVAVVKDGVVQLQKINIVRDFGTEVEVNTGVKRGDQVILNPSVDLVNGSKVKVNRAPTQTS